MAESQGGMAGRQPRLLDRVRDKIRVKHYSLRTEQAYLYWIKRFILFHGKRQPAEMGEMHVSAFLSRLAVADKVAASTQNQALSALLFLYREVLDRKLAWMDDMRRAKRPAQVPVVLTHGEVESLLSRLHLERVRALHQRDLAQGYGGFICRSPLSANIPMPGASGRGVRVGAWSRSPTCWGCDGGGARYGCEIISTRSASSGGAPTG